ncbi:unnamed protein product [Mytilus edulis]|uniref:Uncharacterized protein n=1 Tax=Mytilus edulis TaxID=6550 RepID=A0A8S3QCW4_MYTED|nr:unnamed protein product [Mytilus edulis]
MDECPSPVKCASPPMKRGRMSINWQRCLICQNITQETLSMTTDRGFTTFNECSNILPVVHALPGCETTTAIFIFGKKTVFKLIRKSPSKFTNLQNFDTIDFSSSLSAARELISSLYNPKDKFASSYVDLNKLCVKLATCKDTSLLRLPPSEPAFKEHVSCLQTKMWMSSHLDHPNHLSPYEYGWKKSSPGPDPVYFFGMMTSDFLQDLLFSCKGKYICSTS